MSQGLPDRAFPNCKSSSFFEETSFYFHSFDQELHPKNLLYKDIFSASNYWYLYWFWRGAEPAVGLKHVGGLSVGHTSAVMTGSWLLLAIVCLFPYSNSGLYLVIP